MKYNVKWIEVKKTGNTNGRDWTISEMTLVDEQGNETEKVSTFDTIMNGVTIEGEIIKNDKGYLSFKKAESPKANFMQAKKEEQIGRVMEKKAEYIEKAQDRKNESIAFFNATNSAIAFVSTFKDMIDAQNARDYFEKVCYYRDLFIDEWNKWDKVPF